jgi:hypothetical protein
MTVQSDGNPRTKTQEAPVAQKASPEPGKPTKERAAEASKLSKLAQTYLDKAKEEDQAAALALATSGMGDEYQRHKAAADSARSIAAELQRRAYILENGTESNYRQLMFQQYGINNPELNKIAAYYAEKFNDQATLNWLKLQHPAKRPKLDANGLAMMALLPEGEAADEALQAGSAEEKSAFEKATDIEGNAPQAGNDVSQGGGKGSANENTKNAASRGTSRHSDKPGNLPDQLRDKYPDTNLEFTKPGVKGQDVKVVGGKHPSEYPDSDWSPGADHGDFKPDTPGGTKTFNHDQKNKWTEPTQKVPYDPSTGKLK